MQNLPSAEVYEKEFTYMPWGKLIHRVEKYVLDNVPQRGKVLDMLCGPGYLLGNLQRRRSDLDCRGVDLEPDYIHHAVKLYPEVRFECADAFKWHTRTKYDAVLCTAGVHHLPDQQQEPFIGKLAQLLKPTGFLIVADPYIGDYVTRQGRILASAEFGYQYLVATIKQGAPLEVIDAALQVLRNDVLLIEWKTSVEKQMKRLKRYFRNISKHRTWPDHTSAYGDYYFVCRQKK